MLLELRLSSLLVHIILLLNKECTWFLKFAFMQTSVCVHTFVYYVCVSAPKVIIVNGMMWHDIDDMIGQTSFTAFKWQLNLILLVGMAGFELKCVIKASLIRIY